MKKIFITLLAVLLLTPIVGVFNRSVVKGDDYYSYSCSYDKYEVDYINDDGSFTSKGCYSEFADAKKAMKDYGEDHVVRHASSLSPTKIIAMNSGLVYSYPGRSGTNTMNIYQDVSNRSAYYKQTYVANHYEMQYVDTERYLPKYNGGIVQIVLNGFSGFADLEYTDLVPSKYLDKGIGLYLGGNNTYDGESAFYVVPTRNYFEAVKNGNYTDLAFHYSRAYPENGNKPIQYTIYIGKAPSFMNIGTRYYSADGVNFYSDTNLKNLVGTYYNYYQFLPLRSKTDISATTLENFLSSARSDSIMSGHCSDFISEQNTYGVNGLLLFAMACTESAYGTSGYAKNRNNLFGWNAVDADPSKASYFSSVSACINEQAGINIRGYIDITDGRFFSSSLGNKGSGMNVKYASDPYWSMKIASIAYACDKYSKGKDGTYTDYDKYSLSLINEFDIAFKKEANDSSATLYTTQYGPYYQKDFVVISLERGNNYTKVQSTNAIDSAGNIKTHRTPITTGNLNPISTYDFDLSVGYIKNSYLTDINSTKVKNTENEDLKEDNPVGILSSVSKFAINDSNLQIEGTAFIEGMNANDSSLISHKLVVKNIIDGSVYKEYNCETIEKSSFDIGDDYLYKYIGYKVSIPLNDIDSGSYYFEMLVNNKSESMSVVLQSYLDKYTNNSSLFNNLTYHISTDEYYDYRFEMDVESLPDFIDYSSIKKPSTRSSLFSFNSMTLDEELNLSIKGLAMIYYLNYPTVESTKYTIYLIDDKDNYLTIPATTEKSTIDYKEMFESSYDLSCIKFEGNGNLSNLKKGNYIMLIKIENGDNIDFVEMSSVTHKETPTITVGDITYRVYVSDIRDRLMLEVK